MHGYIAVVHGQPGTGYRVAFPALPGCAARAKSVEHALDRARRALRDHVTEILDKGGTLPPPRPSWAVAEEARRSGAQAAACLTVDEHLLAGTPHDPDAAS